jgi:hypothetical protein
MRSGTPGGSPAAEGSGGRPREKPPRGAVKEQIEANLEHVPVCEDFGWRHLLARPRRPRGLQVGRVFADEPLDLIPHHLGMPEQ